MSTIEKAYAEKDFLMKELNHRVKNNLITVNSLITLKSSTLGEQIDLSDLIHQINTIRIVHEKLYQTEDISHVNIREYIQDLLSTVFSFSHKPIKIKSHIKSMTMSTNNVVPIGLI